MSAERKTFECWAILELLGHRRVAGYVTETETAGHGFLRVEIPAIADHDEVGAPATQFYAPGSVYALTPTTEAIARGLATRPAPVHPWELPRRALEVAGDRAYDDERERDHPDGGPW